MMSATENLPPQVMSRLGKELKKLVRAPPDGIKFIPNEEERVDEIHAEIAGPVGTPFEGGYFRVKLVLTKDFPSSPPRGYFLTRIYHPNVAANGDICVNTLKKDWKADLGIAHVLAVIRCLLIVPFPESSLNDEAGRLFMESYDEYARRAKLHTGVHASQRHSECEASGSAEAAVAEGGPAEAAVDAAAGAADDAAAAVGEDSVLEGVMGAGSATPSKKVKASAAAAVKGKGAKGDKTKKKPKKKGGVNRL